MASPYQNTFNFQNDNYKSDLTWTRTPDKVDASKDGLQVYMVNIYTYKSHC